MFLVRRKKRKPRWEVVQVRNQTDPWRTEAVVVYYLVMVGRQGLECYLCRRTRNNSVGHPEIIQAIETKEKRCVRRWTFFSVGVIDGLDQMKEKEKTVKKLQVTFDARRYAVPSVDIVGNEKISEFLQELLKALNKFPPESEIEAGAVNLDGLPWLQPQAI